MGTLLDAVKPVICRGLLCEALQRLQVSGENFITEVLAEREPKRLTREHPKSARRISKKVSRILKARALLWAKDHVLPRKVVRLVRKCECRAAAFEKATGRLEAPGKRDHEALRRSVSRGVRRVLARSRTNYDECLEVLREAIKELSTARDCMPAAKLSRKRVQAFIVHGRAVNLAGALKNYLQNTLRLPEPIILAERANLGKTLIEKFEHYAGQTTLAFVLMTPDDKAAGPDDKTTSRRARQNVIFELGYFLAKLKRETGRVFLLYKGKLEMPSDLSGMVYIELPKRQRDAKAAIGAISDDIRKELDALGIK